MSTQTTITYTGQLVTATCWCGIRYAMPSELERWHRQDEKNAVYCPLGHAGVIRKTDADRLRAQLDQAQADARWQRGQREAAQRRVTALKGQVTKARKRAAKGVCPHPECKRSFVNVARHVATCHPDFDPASGVMEER